MRNWLFIVVYIVIFLQGGFSVAETKPSDARLGRVDESFPPFFRLLTPFLLSGGGWSEHEQRILDEADKIRRERRGSSLRSPFFIADVGMKEFGKIHERVFDSFELDNLLDSMFKLDSLLVDAKSHKKYEVETTTKEGIPVAVEHGIIQAKDDRQYYYKTTKRKGNKDQYNSKRVLTIRDDVTKHPEHYKDKFLECHDCDLLRLINQNDMLTDHVPSGS